jgi:glycosyltransferase involved in cell wall biosynthesis
MRLGVAFEPCANAYYRAIEPMKAMERRGHSVVWPDAAGHLDPRRVAGCDVVHVYRRAAGSTRKAMAALRAEGCRITYDNDDDYTTFPKESPDYGKYGGLAGQRIFTETVAAAKLAHAASTTTEPLAEKYRRAGIDPIFVIGNHLAHGVARSRRKNDGIVVGWIAGLDHRADLAHIRLTQALRELVTKRHNVRVTTVGVKLNLPERYTHVPLLQFAQLPDCIGGFDIGIAPLADIPFNRHRSDIKVKEYAASGVPWLASPVGPYSPLGPGQGGFLVPDDKWLEALDGLATHRFTRWRLGRRGRAWSSRQTIETVAERWEDFFLGETGVRHSQPPRPS